MLSAVKKARFAFLALPETLQDEIVDGLDSRTLSLEDASGIVKSKGFSLSATAIRKYYAAVRRERRLNEANRYLERIVEGFANQSCEETLKSLTNLIVAMAALGLADGTIGIKDIDLPGVLRAIHANTAAKGHPDGRTDVVAPERPRGLSPETVSEIRRKILGCKS